MTASGIQRHDEYHETLKATELYGRSIVKVEIETQGQ